MNVRKKNVVWKIRYRSQFTLFVPNWHELVLRSICLHKYQQHMFHNISTKCSTRLLSMKSDRIRVRKYRAYEFESIDKEHGCTLEAESDVLSCLERQTRTYWGFEIKGDANKTAAASLSLSFHCLQRGTKRTRAKRQRQTNEEREKTMERDEQESKGSRGGERVWEEIFDAFPRNARHMEGKVELTSRYDGLIPHWDRLH